MSSIHPPCHLALMASPERRRAAGRACFGRPRTHDITADPPPVSKKTCKRSRESVVAVGADSNRRTWHLFRVDDDPLQSWGCHGCFQHGVLSTGDVGPRPRACWIHSGAQWVRVCVWVPGCQLCFFLSAAAIISLGLLPSSPGSRAMASAAPFQWKRPRWRWWLLCRNTQLPAVLLM